MKTNQIHIHQDIAQSISIATIRLATGQLIKGKCIIT